MYLNKENNMEKKLEVIINIGCPASGKSTFTTEFLKKNPGWVKVSRDDFRYMLKGVGFCEPKIEKMITHMHNQAIVTALANKLNVIVDNTHLKVSSISEIINLVKEYASVKYMVFDVPKKTLLERDALRERKVGKDVIEKMWKQWLILKDSFDFQPVPCDKTRNYIIPNFNSKLPNAIIFDIDGTLALMGKRSPFDWDKVDRDNLNQIVSEQIAFHKSLGRKIIIVSGRDESCRKITEDWFKFYDVEFDLFFMRPKDNYEKDTVIKKRIYENDIKPFYNVLAVYDDRRQVLDMWFKEGIFTFNVNQGEKIF